MPQLDRNHVYEKFKKFGFNSSHFVWMLAELEYYETQNGYVFAYQTLNQITLIALEPLSPGEEASFSEAWAEFEKAIHPEVSAFVSIYETCVQKLQAIGFQTIKIGSEPWVKLSECNPKGNAGKGVRSARNQAVKAGLTVEEWSASEIKNDSDKQQTIRDIYQDWSGPQWVKLNGFTLATDPFAYMDDRRYFVLRSQEKVEAYLVASPVPLTQSYYLEDIILRRDAPRGAGEFLTLEAMTHLNNSGAFEASLGVVAGSDCKNEPDHNLPAIVHFFMVSFPRVLNLVYNAEGQEIYRKRFKPHRWAGVYLAVKKHPTSKMSDTLAWFKVLKSLLFALKPEVRLHFGAVYKTLFMFIERYKLTFTVALLNFGIFALVNHGRALPSEILNRYGFASAVPWYEWIFRSITSDYLYLNLNHLILCSSALIGVLAWAERTQKFRFLVSLFVLTSIFDDVVNYVLVVLPFKRFQPSIYEFIIGNRDVGGSLILSLLVGLQLCQLRKMREIIYVLVSVGSLIAIALNSNQLSGLVINLNHLVFLAIGFCIGKLNFELGRRHSRAVANGKTPQVLPAQDSSYKKKAA